MLSLLDRYILRHFFLYFLAGLLIFITLFLAIDFMTKFSKYDVDMLTLGRYYGYLAPEIAYKMFPVAAMLGTIMTLSNLNKSNELVALHSAGVSLFRIYTPMLISVVLICVSFFIISNQFLPILNQKKNYIKYVEIKKKPYLYSTVKTDKVWYRSKNKLFNLQTLNNDERRAEGLTLYYFDESWKLTDLIKAKNVKLRGGAWQLTDGVEVNFNRETSFPETKNFHTKMIMMGEEVGDINSTESSSEQMTTKALSKFIQKNREAGLDTLSYQVDYHAKYSFALGALVMALLSIPFSVKKARGGGAMVGIGVCIGLSFMYWLFFSSSLSVGKYGVVHPFVAAWAPNILIGLLAVYLIRKVHA